MPLKHLIYLSDLVGRDESVLPAIVESAMRNNQRNGVTGMLLYADGNFLQVIEGEAAAVESTFVRISQDPRHGHITVLLEEGLAQRHFSQWSMGYKRLSAQDVAALPQQAPAFRYGLHAPGLLPTPGDALDLLQMFAQDAL